MRDLTRANELMAAIAAKEPRITAITPADFDLFQSFFEKEPHTYGNSWTYITQGMYGIGPHKLGYKYFDGQNLSAITTYPRVEDPDMQVLFWIRPMGKTIIPALFDISKKVQSDLNLNVYAKKLFVEQYNELVNLGFHDVSTFPWHAIYPMEDDTFPEQIYDVEHTIDLAEHSVKGTKIRRSHRYYKSIQKQSEVTHLSSEGRGEEVIGIIDSFFTNDPKVKSVNISNPFDYYGLTIRNPKARMYGQIYYFKEKPISFYCIEKQAGNYASQYATLSLREDSNHIVDFMMFDIFYTLRSEGISKLNLGGSETKTLDEFKKKYQPVAEQQMYWAALTI